MFAVARDSLGALAFRQDSYDLGPVASGGRLTLEPVGAGDAGILGAAFAAIDPWAAYRATPAGLERFFAMSEQDCCRRSIRVDGVLAGAVVVRSPWLHGPYLQFLGVMPGYQGTGLGAAVLAWMEREAGPATRNLWLCVSHINERARVFYERQGFELAGILDGLAANGMDELLMRKRITARTA